jgi:hypothetical protein
MASEATRVLAARLKNLEESCPPPCWIQVEPLVTDGYALVLALEAERLRVMRELVDLPAKPQTADRAAALTRELDDICAELAGLRERVGAVRRRFSPNGFHGAAVDRLTLLRHEPP